MIYYQNKVSGQIIGSLNNLRDKINFNGQRDGCITDVIIPSECVGDCVICHVMDYRDIKKGYKRISKTKAFEIYPDFGQLRHRDTIINDTIIKYGQYYLNQLKPMVKSDYGISFKKPMPDELKNEALEAATKHEYIQKESKLAALIFVRKRTNWDSKKCETFVNSLT